MTVMILQRIVKRMVIDQIPNLDSQSVRPIHNLEASSIRPIHTLEASSVRPIQTIETPLVDIQNHSLKPMQQAIPTIPRVAVRPNPSMQLNPPESTTEPWKLTEPILASEQPISNSIRPYFDSKHVSQNTSMIKSSISSKIPPLHNHCITHRNIVNKCNHHDVNSVHSNYSSSLTNTNCNNLTLQNSPVMTIPSAQNKITMPTHNARPMNRVLPMQAVTKLDSTKSNQKSDIPLEEPTKPEIKFIETEIVLPPKDISPVIKPEIKLKINNLEMIDRLKSGPRIDAQPTVNRGYYHCLQGESWELYFSLSLSLPQLARSPILSIDFLP